MPLRKFTTGQRAHMQIKVTEEITNYIGRSKRSQQTLALEAEHAQNTRFRAREAAALP